MYFFKFTMTRRRDDLRVTGPLAAFRVGLPIDPEDALIDIAVGDATNGTRSHIFIVGWESLAFGAAGVFAVNAIIGWLSGSIGSVPDLLVSNFDPTESLGPKAVFVAGVVAHAAMAEIGKRYVRDRNERIAAKAITWRQSKTEGE